MSPQQDTNEPLSPRFEDEAGDKTETTHKGPANETELLLDEALDETFPASDAISSMRFTPGR
ncbi:hypothetical protein J2Z50_000120 [Ensifer mexicanus]|nr:hypothetical protein [Sinorhizobium mexicanum]